MEENVKNIIQYLGEDPDREGLVDTPRRVIKMWNDITNGYNLTPADILTTFDSDGYDQIIALRDIEMYSICEHHMLPFIGKAHVAYIPKKRLIGISKLARLVDMYARRLQIQERIGEQVTTALMQYLDCEGAVCIIGAEHLCMQMRGVNKQNSVMITSSLKGVFLENPTARQEVLSILQSKS